MNQQIHNAVLISYIANAFVHCTVQDMDTGITSLVGLEVECCIAEQDEVDGKNPTNSSSIQSG